MNKPNGATVFALKAYTIKRNGEKFHISPSVAYRDKPQWSKGYRSLQAARSAVARKLAEEWVQRNDRRRTFYGVRKGRQP